MAETADHKVKDGIRYALTSHKPHAEARTAMKKCRTISNPQQVGVGGAAALDDWHTDLCGPRSMRYSIAANAIKNSRMYNNKCTMTMTHKNAAVEQLQNTMGQKLCMCVCACVDCNRGHYGKQHEIRSPHMPYISSVNAVTA